MENRGLPYHGLVTRKMTVEGPVILATSAATIKVKTQTASSGTTNWEEDNAGSLTTSFESSFN